MYGICRDGESVRGGEMRMGRDAGRMRRELYGGSEKAKEMWETSIRRDAGSI